MRDPTGERASDPDTAQKAAGGFVRVDTEEDAGTGWVFGMTVGADAGSRCGETRRLRMSWADYEHWCGGRTPPAEVAERVMRFLVARRPLAQIGAQTDAASVRRWAPALDDEMRRRFGGT